MGRIRCATGKLNELTSTTRIKLGRVVAFLPDGGINGDLVKIRNLLTGKYEAWLPNSDKIEKLDIPDEIAIENLKSGEYVLF